MPSVFLMRPNALCVEFAASTITFANQSLSLSYSLRASGVGEQSSWLLVAGTFCSATSNVYGVHLDGGRTPHGSSYFLRRRRLQFKCLSVMVLPGVALIALGVWMDSSRRERDYRGHGRSTRFSLPLDDRKKVSARSLRCPLPRSAASGGGKAMQDLSTAFFHEHEHLRRRGRVGLAAVRNVIVTFWDIGKLLAGHAFDTQRPSREVRTLRFVKATTKRTAIQRKSPRCLPAQQAQLLPHPYHRNRHRGGASMQVSASTQ